MAEENIELTEEEIALASAPIGEDAQVEEIMSESVDESTEESVEESVDESEVQEEVAEDEAVENDSTGDIGLSEEDYTLGQSYGLSKEEIDDLGSRDLIEKFGRINARQAMELKPKEEEKKEVKEEVPEQEQESVAGWDISKIDLEEYDDVTQSAFSAIDQLQKKIAQLESQNQRLEETKSDGAISEFNNQLDTLDPDFFGKQGNGPKPSSMSKDQMDRRMKLAETIDMITAGLSSQGKQIPSLDVLIRDANALAFRERTEQLRKNESQKRLKKQAARRQSSGSRVSKQVKSAEPYDSEEAEIQRILAETDEAYQRMLEEN
jgi:hypothetical protein